MSKIDKQRHAELSERVSSLELDLRQAEEALATMREDVNITAAALGKLLRMLGLI